MENIKFTATALQDYILNIIEENEEDKNFIKANLENELIIKDFDTINKTIKVSRYEQTRSYDLPIYLFETNDLFKDSESEQEESKIIHKFAWKDFKIEKAHIVAWLMIISLSLIIFKATDFSSANLLTTWPINKQLKTNDNVYLLQTEKKNKNNLEKAKELEEQKKLRDLLEKSVNKVKMYDVENKTIDQQLILLSQ